MLNYDLHRDAERELDATALRYNNLVPGLGPDFIDEIESAILWVCTHPSASQRWPDV